MTHLFIYKHSHIYFIFMCFNYAYICIFIGVGRSDEVLDQSIPFKANLHF